MVALLVHVGDCLSSRWLVGYAGTYYYYYYYYNYYYYCCYLVTRTDCFRCIIIDDLVGQSLDQKRSELVNICWLT